MTSMVLASVMATAGYTWIFAVSVPNVLIELGLTPPHPVGSVSLGFSDF